MLIVLTWIDVSSRSFCSWSLDLLFECSWNQWEVTCWLASSLTICLICLTPITPGCPFLTILLVVSEGTFVFLIHERVNHVALEQIGFNATEMNTTQQQLWFGLSCFYFKDLRPSDLTSSFTKAADTRALVYRVYKHKTTYTEARSKGPRTT